MILHSGSDRVDRQIRANRRGWRAATRLVLALALVWWSPGRAESLEPVTEERLMDQHGYERTIIHKQAHRKLLEDLLSIRRQFNSASLVLTLQALKEWLCQHIRSSDRHQGEALIASRAVQPQAAARSNPST